MTEITVITECGTCGGTGLFRGYIERQRGKNHAVVCLACNGSGKRELKYKPFAGRNRLEGITAIQVSGGHRLIDTMGGVGKEMTYEEFETTYVDDLEAMIRDHLINDRFISAVRDYRRATGGTSLEECKKVINRIKAVMIAEGKLKP